MRKLILFTIFGLYWQASAQDICASILFTPRFEKYVEAVAPRELTQESFGMAAIVLADAFDGLLLSSDDRIRVGITETEASRNVDLAKKEFDIAVNAEVRGWFKTRDEHLENVAAILNRLLRSAVAKNKLVELAQHVARHPHVEEVLALAPFYMQRKESLEYIFLLSLNHDRSLSLSFGPREMALAREALQYAHLTDGDTVLQLGVASPAALTTMRHYQGAVDFRGISASVPSAAAIGWANIFGVSLATGTLADAGADLPAASFRMIIALDGTESRASGPEQLAKLKQLLVPHGSVVMVYDYDRTPDFTEIEALDAGFQVLSWGRPRHLESNMTEVVYGVDRPAGAGHLHAFVLRLGDEDAERRPPTVNEIELPAR